MRAENWARADAIGSAAGTASLYAVAVHHLSGYLAGAPDAARESLAGLIKSRCDSVTAGLILS